MSNPNHPPEAWAKAAASGTVALTQHGVLRAQGDQALEFLHGQLTQDMAQLPENEGRLAGYCSPKGRLLASFMALRPSAEEVLLITQQSVLASALKRLGMFVLRSRCKLSDASAEHPLWGLWGEDARLLMGESDWPVAQWRALPGSEPQTAWALRLPDVHGVARMIVCSASAPGPARGSLDVWQGLSVHSGVIEIEAINSDQFVPQMVNFELVGGVNFRKGCYPGQEVVARSQYRGTVKRRVQLMFSAQALSAGDEVFDAQDPQQPAGRVVNAAAWGLQPGQHSALVELKLQALLQADGQTPREPTLRLGSAQGPGLSLGELPYRLDADLA